MYKRILLILIFTLLSDISYANNDNEKVYYYKDYINLLHSFGKEGDEINKKVSNANNRYNESLKKYQSCPSKSIWRIFFKFAIPEINKRGIALGEYKKEALNRKRSLNLEWLNTAEKLNINHIAPDQDISQFFLWYKNHIETVKQGPLNELKIYIIALSKLTDVYEKMARACKGDPEATKDYELIESSIRGIFDEVFNLIGRAF